MTYSVIITVPVCEAALPIFDHSCQTPFEATTGTCFWLLTNYLSEYQEAVGFCQEGGGYLAQVDTPEVFDFIMLHLRYFLIFLP